MEHSAERYRYSTEVVRTSRRTLALEVRAPGVVIVRAPHALSARAITAALDASAPWIARALERVARRYASAPDPLTLAERSALHARARATLPDAVMRWVPVVGASPTAIQIRQQRTRWGSCSARGTISLNAQLLTLEPAVIDYVIVHELCHLLHHNHSPQFWASVQRVLPNYRAQRAQLREAVIR